MESPVELADKENDICLNWRLDYLPILVMPLSFVFLPVYIPLVNISNAACSSTHVRKNRKCDEAIIKIWRSAAKRIPEVDGKSH